jgi:hypothetical protein
LNASLGLLATSFAKFCNIGFTFSLGFVLSLADLICFLAGLDNAFCTACAFSLVSAFFALWFASYTF